MRVIILAAGTGSRLMPLTKNTPKSLLDIGSGETVLECQLNNIRRAGIDYVTIVVGYKANQIEAKVADIKGLRISTMYNPFYDVSNNLVSAWFARHEMLQDDFILLNGDNVVRTEVFDKLLAAPNEITMVIDKKPKYDDDDMKVMLNRDRVIRVGKDIPAHDAHGESIGMIKFQGAGRDWMVRTLDRLVRTDEGKQVFYLRALQAIMDDGLPVNYVECLPDDWAEIDFHPDLDYIRENLERWAQVVTAWRVAGR